MVLLPSQLCTTTPRTHIHNAWTSGDGGEAIVTNSAADKAADTIQIRREYAWHAGYLPHVGVTISNDRRFPCSRFGKDHRLVQNLTLTPPYSVRGAAGVIVRGFSSTVPLRPTPTGSPATLRKASVSK
jgi:hypothetical protein